VYSRNFGAFHLIVIIVEVFQIFWVDKVNRFENGCFGISHFKLSVKTNFFLKITLLWSICFLVQMFVPKVSVCL